MGMSLKLCVSVVAFLLLGFGAHAATCSPKDATELVQTLDKLSPFTGTWHWDNPSGKDLSGTSRMTITALSGNKLNVSWFSNSSFGRAQSVQTTSSQSISFKANGAVSLRLGSDCRLTGIQKYTAKGKTYNVRLVLRPR